MNHFERIQCCLFNIYNYIYIFVYIYLYIIHIIYIHNICILLLLQFIQIPDLYSDLHEKRCLNHGDCYHFEDATKMTFVIRSRSRWANSFGNDLRPKGCEGRLSNEGRLKGLEYFNTWMSHDVVETSSF